MSLFGDSQFFCSGRRACGSRRHNGPEGSQYKTLRIRSEHIFHFHGYEGQSGRTDVVRRVPGDPVHHRQGVS